MKVRIEVLTEHGWFVLIETETTEETFSGKNMEQLLDFFKADRCSIWKETWGFRLDTTKIIATRVRSVE